MNKAIVRPVVVVPCLNEERAIHGLLREILAHCRDVIVVDDASSDHTAEMVAQLPVTLLRHASHRGKGEALRTGFRRALELGASGVLTMDGDGQHDPADIPRLLAAARRHPGAFVIGARLLEDWRQPASRRRANRVADWGISWACGQPLTDTQSGLRWYPRAAVELLELPAQDFVFETAILIAACRDLRLPVMAVPIACRYGRSTRRSHFRPLRDTLRIARYTSGRVLHYGQLLQAYRASRDMAPYIHDPGRQLRQLDATAPQPDHKPPPALG